MGRILTWVCGVLVFASVFLGSCYQIKNYDFWWHLKTGEIIWDLGKIPGVELASFTAAGTPWADYEWLFQVAVHAAHTAVGIPGVVLIKAALALLTFVLLYFALRAAGASPLVALALVLPAFSVAHFRLLVRPEIVSFPLFAALVLVTRRYLRDGVKKGPSLILVPALMVPWANTHPGFIFGVGFLCLVTAGGVGNLLLRRWRSLDREWEWEDVRRFGLMTILAFGASFAGPFSYKTYLLILQHLPEVGTGGGGDSGWVPTEWQRLPFEGFGLLWLILLASGITFLARPTRFDLREFLPLAFFGGLAVAMARNASLFPLFALPFLVSAWEAPVRRWVPARYATYCRAALVGFLIAFPFVDGARAVGDLKWKRPEGRLLPRLADRDDSYRFGLGVNWERYPRDAADFVERWIPAGHRGYNDYRFGGYLEWRFYPQRKVFYDGKHIPYLDLFREISVAMTKGAPSWLAMTERHRITYAVTEYDPRMATMYFRRPDGQTVTARRSLSAALFDQRHWALVYWDDTAMVFVRRIRPMAEVIDRFEYRYVNPEDWAFVLGRVEEGAVPARAVLEELRRRIRRDPASTRAVDCLHDLLRAMRVSEGRASSRGQG